MKTKFWLIAIIAFIVVVLILLLRSFFSVEPVNWKQIDSQFFSSEKKTVEKIEYKKSALANFNFKMPAGWQKITAPPGVALMVVKGDELVTDLSTQKANFKSYFSVSQDSAAGQMELEQYVKYYQQAVLQSLSDMAFSEVIGLDSLAGHSAKALEITSQQNGSDYRALVVFVQAKDKSIWTLGFNTLATGWSANKPIFDSVINSFEFIQ